MEKPVDIVLTKADLKYGKPGKCLSCPIARAINRQLIDGFEAVVKPTWIGIKAAEHGGMWDLPYRVESNMEAYYFINTFDYIAYQGMKLAPGDPVPNDVRPEMLKPGFLTTLMIPEELLA